MKLVSIAALLAASTPLIAQHTYSLDLDQPPKPLTRGHLDLGGAQPGGGRIEVNSYFIEKDGKPFIPIVGEFHFGRYPAAHWEEALRTMKAGGINVVATYVFWNFHERTEGKFDWSGNLDLRRFIETADKVGLQCLVRVGPFDHGEIRNGGLPDWLYGKPFEIRSNDPGYLALAERLYGEIGAQLKGLFYKDGGPIIGIQLENEFQHSAAPWEIRYQGAPLELTVAERDLSVTHGGVAVSHVVNENARYGQDHMVNLKKIAQAAGLDAPLYTATGWGNAAIVPKGSLPVTAGYAFPFWSDATPSPFYLFKDIQAEPDYSPVSFEAKLYPSLPAELGAGIMPTYRRRPFVPEESVEPMIVRVLGSGSNGVGYYMYHGGTNPVFDTFMNEDSSYGSPKINYDYQAPLGQYGKPKAHYQTLRLLHHFIGSFGERLAPLASLLPESNARITPGDATTLRFAARAAEGSGFVFILNYQDHLETRDLEGVALDLRAKGEHVRIPAEGTLTVRKGTSAILPVNLPVGSALLRSATVQPLAVLQPKAGAHYVFFSVPGVRPELVFSKGRISALENCTQRTVDGHTVISSEEGQMFSFAADNIPVLVVPRALALEAVAAPSGHLFFCDAVLLAEENSGKIRSIEKNEVSLRVFPADGLAVEVDGARLEALPSPLKAIGSYRVTFEKVSLQASLTQLADRRFAVKFNQPLGALNDALLRIDYVGSDGMAFIGGRMIDDHFYHGRTWEIGLRDWAKALAKEDLVLLFHALPADAAFFGEIPEAARPVFAPGQKKLLSVKGVSVVPEYSATLRWR